ncbi:hypothetical protein BU25DRAFT_129897 [Macroventuria anomochaeta]|uniref:Uncharacterized protein n=1 Tax=Macroventuria anomochaeta TaxID=301207 RepID=A0ACB6RVM0_9PLEO|nr:uncharacterized protein BU25DRAFT_129897 [Macroventuria anomochaeta]KAF2624984.1 hypothetical protein BU25DRAFT_129897 [Macroventuria anomochaeta]
MDRSSSSPAMMIDAAASTSLEPPRKVRRATLAGPSDFGSIVTINVGIKPDHKTFMLHGHALRSSSNYFAIAMDVQCAVADEDKPVNLPDITIEDFAVYAKFLYTGLLFTKEANVTELTRCLHLYKVAKHLEAMDFQDAIVDALIENIVEFRALKGQCRFTATQITTIYTMTEEDSPLRKFAQDLCLQSKGPQGFEKRRLKDFPVDFQLDLLTAAAPFITSSAKSTDMQDPLDLGRSCKYHKHTVLGTPCYRTKYQFMPDEPVVVAASVAASVAAKSKPAAGSRRQTERLASNDFELRV